ncbi:unnamed protein product [Lota lota]
MNHRWTMLLLVSLAIATGGVGGVSDVLVRCSWVYFPTAPGGFMRPPARPWGQWRKKKRSHNGFNTRNLHTMQRTAAASNGGGTPVLQGSTGQLCDRL